MTWHRHPSDVGLWNLRFLLIVLETKRGNTWAMGESRLPPPLFTPRQIRQSEELKKQPA